MPSNPDRTSAPDAPASPPAGRDLRRILQQGGWYALGNLGIKASGLLLAPIYLDPSYLRLEEFGYFAILMVTSQLGIATVGLGLGRGLLHFIVDPALADRRRQLIATALFACLACAAAAVGLAALFSGPLAGWLLDNRGRTELILLTAAYIGCKVVSDIPLIALRAEERASWYVTVLSGEALAVIAAAYFLVVMRQQGLRGLMAAYAMAAAGSAAILVTATLKQTSRRFDPGFLRCLVRFGSPLMFAALATWALNFSDRYLLKAFRDAATVGLYEWASRLAGLINMLLVQSFQFAFAVIGLKAVHIQDGYQRLHREAFRHYVIGSGWAVLALALFASSLTRILSPDPYYLRAEPQVLLLALGFLTFGTQYVTGNLLYAAGKTRIMSGIALAATLLNLGLNLLLIPRFGATGAALATYFAYLSLSLGNAWYVHRHNRMDFPWSVYARGVGLIVALYGLSRLSAAWSPSRQLAVRSLLVLSYPFLAVAIGLYTREELGRFRHWLGKRRKEPAAQPPIEG